MYSVGNISIRKDANLDTLLARDAKRGSVGPNIATLLTTQMALERDRDRDVLLA